MKEGDEAVLIGEEVVVLHPGESAVVDGKVVASDPPLPNQAGPAEPALFPHTRRMSMAGGAGAPGAGAGAGAGGEEDMVANCLSFLSHPDAAGMTEEEVEQFLQVPAPAPHPSYSCSYSCPSLPSVAHSLPCC